MKYHSCLVSHNPPHSYGDCIRACVASILSVDDPYDVPNFVENKPSPEEFDRRLRAWLKDECGLAPYVAYFDGQAPLQAVLDAMEAHNSGIHYILIGRSANGVNHAVVCRGNRVAHNPGWGAPPLVECADNGFWSAMLFVPAEMRE